MLTAIRERATGWIAWLIVGFITVPFALWGVNSYFQGDTIIATATVNGVNIPYSVYQNELAAQRQSLAQRLGADFDPALLDSLGIRQRVINGLIDNQLLNQFTDDQNFRISDQQLIGLIQSFPAFLEDGVFSQARYQELLAANRLNPQGFEQSQRLTGVVNQLQEGINDTAFFTKTERDRMLVLHDQSRHAQYAVLKASSFVDEFTIEEDEVKKFYEENSDLFQTEARMKVEYIELSIDSLSKTVVPSEEEIETLYVETKGRYKKAESRKASHILVNVDQSASEEEKQTKLDLANEILAKANSGDDFSILAKLYSDDPGSKDNGGDLGVVAKGQMVKSFEDAVFDMRKGEIRGPIQTTFGYHIITLTELEEGSQQSLEDVRQQLQEDARQIQAESQFTELAESFKNLVFEDPDNITTAADELGLKIQTSDWFTTNEGKGVAVDATVRRAAYSEDVLNENLVSPAIEIGFDKLVAVQKVAFEASGSKSIEAVKTQITNSLKAEKSEARVLQTGSDYLTELRSMDPVTDSWSFFSEEHELKVETLAEKKAEIPANLIVLGDAVFALPKPESGQVKFGGVALENGDYALLILENVESGNVEAIDEPQQTLVQQQLLARDGVGLFSQFRVLLRENADIEISEDRL